MGKPKSAKSKITVYAYWAHGKHGDIYDAENGLRTQKYVEARKGSIIAGTAEIVNESDLDEDGRYFRKFD